MLIFFAAMGGFLLGVFVGVVVPELVGRIGAESIVGAIGDKIASIEDSREVVAWREVRHPTFASAIEYELTLANGSVYVGNCTVWHHVPSCERASTFMESYLATQWERARRGHLDHLRLPKVLKTGGEKK